MQGVEKRGGGKERRGNDENRRGWQEFMRYNDMSAVYTPPPPPTNPFPPCHRFIADFPIKRGI